MSEPTRPERAGAAEVTQGDVRWAYIEGYAAGAAHFGGPATETPAVLRAPLEYDLWRQGGEAADLPSTDQCCGPGGHLVNCDCPMPVPVAPPAAGEPCPTCEGTGTYYEPHGEAHADEELSCRDCNGTGKVPPSEAPAAGEPLTEAIRAEALAILAHEPVAFAECTVAEDVMARARRILELLK